MVSPDVQKAWEGRVVAGKFPLQQWLGSSEHSAVFLTQRQPGKASQKATIKLIAADAADAERQLSRWRAAAQLSHPNLIRIFEAGRCELNGTPLLYVAMEYAEEDLAEILPQRPLTPAEVAELIPPVLDALSYLHQKGFVHGDIRPSNVLAVGDQLKLSSDQVTSAAETDSARRRRDVYDAPETAAGIVSPAGDLWSLGVTLVAALTQNTSLVEGAQVPAALETLPEPFRGIARECLRLDPNRRCSIALIQARLQPPGRSVPVEPEAPPPPRSVSKGTIAAVVAVVALVVALVVFYPRGKNTAATEKVTPGQTAPAQTASSPRSAKPTKKAATQGAPSQTAPSQSTATQGTVAQGDVLHQVLPDVPQSARDTVTGTVKVGVRVTVDSSGKVTAAELASPGPSPYFARLALNAAQGWEFAPPQVDGQPAASVWLLRFRFRRTSTQAAAERVGR
ncbi:MAG: serine/threonine-protein kinase [Candidatus Sulfotelmatobacter sp.]